MPLFFYKEAIMKIFDHNTQHDEINKIINNHQLTAHHRLSLWCDTKMVLTSFSENCIILTFQCEECGMELVRSKTTFFAREKL